MLHWKNRLHVGSSHKGGVAYQSAKQNYGSLGKSHGSCNENS